MPTQGQEGNGSIGMREPRFTTSPDGPELRKRRAALFASLSMLERPLREERIIESRIYRRGWVRMEVE